MTPRKKQTADGVVSKLAKNAGQAGENVRPIIMKVAKDPDPPCPFGLS